MHCAKKGINMWPTFVTLVTLRCCDNSAQMINYGNSVYTVGGSIGSTVSRSPATLQMTCLIT